MHDAIDDAHLLSANYLAALQTVEIDLERYSATRTEYLEAILAGLKDVDQTSEQVQRLTPLTQRFGHIVVLTRRAHTTRLSPERQLDQRPP
jgi:hypothetical protein